jgi:2-iminobutanoate/2-iminopropanoate deaminase
MPYSTAIRVNGLIFVSGNVAVNRHTGAMVKGDIREQTRQVLQNLREIVEEAGSSLADAVKVTVYLTDIADFSAMNDVYQEFFPTDPPARATVGVKALSNEAFRVEMDLIAVGTGEEQL